MLEGKAVLRETDMPEAMQSHVMELAYKALDLHEVSDSQSIANYIKQVLYLSLKIFFLLERKDYSSVSIYDFSYMYHMEISCSPLQNKMISLSKQMKERMLFFFFL